MPDAPDDPEAALSAAISRYCAARGVEFTGWRLQEALGVLRHQLQVNRITDRILYARRHILASAVERYEVHDDGAAEALLDRPTPYYPGADRDDAWLRENAGYGIQEGNTPMSEPAAPPRPKPAPDRLRAAVTQRAKPGALQEPDATAAVLLAALLDDPVRIDAHQETLAALPCGGFAAVQALLLDDVGGFEGPATHPAVLELRDALGGQEGPARSYSAPGWERAARGLIARYG